MITKEDHDVVAMAIRQTWVDVAKGNVESAQIRLARLSLVVGAIFAEEAGHFDCVEFLDNCGVAPGQRV